MSRAMLAGILAAALAAFSWSLGYVVPFVIGAYSLFDFALVEFLISGVLSALLLWRNVAAVRRLTPRDWLAGGLLGLIGYFAYFLAVMGAAVYAGPVIAPAFLGLVPVILGLVGNLRDRTVAWGSLALPLSLAAAGLLLVNGSGLWQAGSLQTRSLRLGVPLALAAVALWTLFGLMNQRALARRPAMDAGVWTALIMSGASLSMLAFYPVGLKLGVFDLARVGLHGDGAAPLVGWAAGLAVFANFGGAAAWTFASQRLPVALAAQMITLEPASAMILGLLVHRRWPSGVEVLGMLVLLAGVIIAIRLFAQSAAADRAPATA